MSFPKKIGDVLSQLIRQRGYARVDGNAVERQVWSEIVGPTLASLTRPGELKRGVWEIIAANNMVIQELGFQKATYLAAVQQKLPQHKIKDLRFKVGAVTVAK
jgi:predicted nucleic acid-binding Zn ribbon protein